MAKDTPTANEALLQESLRQQVRLRRYSLWEARRIAALLADSERDLLKALIAGLEGVAGGPRMGTGSRARVESLLGEVAAMRADAWQRVQDELSGNLAEQAKADAKNEKATLDDAVPVDFAFAAPPLEQVAAAATRRPFQGRLLSEWYDSLQAADRRRISEAVRIGVVEGRSADEIVRAVRGTAAKDYEDGVLAATRRDLTAVVRTAVSAVNNAAREEVWAENADVIEGLRWTAVLDGRTSAICMSLDGKVFPVDDGPRPPAHVNCRSVMVAVIDGVEVVGDRPTVTDTRTRREREVDFRRLAKQNGTTVQEERAAWADANVGSVPKQTTYQQFLSGQSAAFQDEVLGPTRGQLFRDGGLTLDAFVDRAGRELTLDDLRRTQPDAWAKAGLS